MANDKLVTCLWFDKAKGARQRNSTRPFSPTATCGTGHGAASDYPGGEQGDELTVDFTVPWPSFPRPERRSELQAQ